MQDKKTAKRPLRNLIIYLSIAAAVAVAIVAYTTRSPGHVSSPAERDAARAEMRH
ncbi:hypothetical protein HL653_14290 [Sphingomonas sp. AP4-R1]|uniref:hypothetical protein n=1 Tax=Sphingomonas sp. AP4-R1 TaxID=2735134 RepID=UPI0014939C76|nr:hypothetical protein [Sphingomonas sp. AP4-R1]QJU58779.1 hypothetical protein HL653_14290 [Sphingomonas sp. AP4-R1]